MIPDNIKNQIEDFIESKSDEYAQFRYAEDSGYHGYYSEKGVETDFVYDLLERIIYPKIYQLKKQVENKDREISGFVYTMLLFLNQ